MDPKSNDILYVFVNSERSERKEFSDQLFYSKDDCLNCSELDEGDIIYEVKLIRKLKVKQQLVMI